MYICLEMSDGTIVKQLQIESCPTCPAVSLIASSVICYRQFLSFVCLFFIQGMGVPGVEFVCLLWNLSASRLRRFRWCPTSDWFNVEVGFVHPRHLCIERQWGNLF